MEAEAEKHGPDESFLKLSTERKLMNDSSFCLRRGGPTSLSHLLVWHQV
jgi:hypothetical protein